MHEPETTLSAAPSFRERIFRERTHRLAQAPNAAGALIDPIDILTFRLAGETFGIESRWITQVLTTGPITPLAGLPTFILGIAGIRGHVYSVVDLAGLLGVSNETLPRPHLLVLEGGAMEFGVCVDACLGQCLIDVETLAKPQSLLDGVFLLGVAPGGIGVLDGSALLTSHRLIVDQG